jgi:hypothetical protein
MPPQQSNGPLDVFDNCPNFRAHEYPTFRAGNLMSTLLEGKRVGHPPFNAVHTRTSDNAVAPAYTNGT